jgi:thiamine biosynthesis protein ThiS
MSKATITITLNGEARHLGAGMSIGDLVSELGLPIQKVAVERNLEIVSRSTLAHVIMAEGDVLEIVHFVGGG